MSIRHIFGFDHIPLGAVDISAYFDTRLKFFVGEGSTQTGTIVSGGWLSGGGGAAFQSIVPQVVQDTPTHVVFGFRAKQNNVPGGNSLFQGPVTLYLAGAFTALFTPAELAATKVNTANGEYFSFDFNLVSGVVRRWVGNIEIAPITNIPVNTLKTAQYAMCTQAYNNSYQSFQYRDFYIGDNFDGVDVQVLGDRVVRSQPVVSAVGSKWAASDGGSLVTALNKPWVTGATDVTALNQTDTSAIRVQFNTSGNGQDVDAVQVECAGSVNGGTLGLKVTRSDDATGKVVNLSSTIKWGARSPIYQSKADGSKISAADLAAMNFDISGA